MLCYQVKKLILDILLESSELSVVAARVRVCYFVRVSCCNSCRTCAGVAGVLPLHLLAASASSSSACTVIVARLNCIGV